MLIYRPLPSSFLLPPIKFLSIYLSFVWFHSHPYSLPRNNFISHPPFFDTLLSPRYKMESENPPNQSPYSRKNRPAPLILGLDHPAAPPPSPKELSRKGPPSLPLNPLPTPRRTAVFHDSTRWTAEEAGNLALACQSGVPLVIPINTHMGFVDGISRLTWIQGWDEIAQLFPGKSPMSCREKFLEIEQLEAEKDRCVYELITMPGGDHGCHLGGG